MSQLESAPRAKVERFGLDAKKRPVSEGYYAVTHYSELIFVPATGEIHKGCLALGYRLATLDEVNAAGGAKDGVGRHARIDELAIPSDHVDFRHHPDANQSEPRVDDHD